MHLLVLSAFRQETKNVPQFVTDVSMHLLVLSAFRPNHLSTGSSAEICLNAPFGAQCFPTEARLAVGEWTVVSMHLLVLSAFRRVCYEAGQVVWVSMHLLVLSAFRPEGVNRRPRNPTVSMHLLVLSAFRPEEGSGRDGR